MYGAILYPELSFLLDREWYGAGVSPTLGFKLCRIIGK
jgi:hypothetical protein